ncbi:mRNA triphosphatase CET1 [Aspergillus campestris IBT 28561]|uniref:mRNA-capping enzyme subunit beta n=1 Tax=Aspergillus campestris (strain IBT 28561) TaxID=1392248 RepID=A0A2I1CWP2_ASPC2|nr:mRNA triphosphatase CET1 [Aspergillus campestris IBT 28561]PKY02051.1 mRNA triphosphatase CET1 [Aspergillus campestris IBT 28561]
MDLRTIMNSDAAGTANSQPQKSPSSQPPPDPNSYPPREHHPAPSPTYPSAYPTNPPPLQRTQTAPERSSSYGSLQSPYQYQSPTAVAPGAQSQRGPSPPPPPFGSSGRDVNSPSATTAYPSQPFSSSQRSLPGTPRASAAPLYSRQTPPSARPQSSGYDSRSNPSSSPWVGSEAQPNHSPVAMSRASRADSGPMDYTTRPYSASSERRGSDESVSPKTAYPPGSGSGSGSRQGSAAAPQRSPVENGAPRHENGSYGPPSSRGSLVPEAPQSSNHPRRCHRSRAPSPPSRPPPPGRPSASGDDSTIPPSSRDVPSAPKVDARSSPIRSPRPQTCARLPPEPLARARAVSVRPGPDGDGHPVPGEDQSHPHCPRRPAVPTTPTVPAVSAVPSPVDGPPAASQPPDPTPAQTPASAPAPASTGSLGPWEPSITGYIPYEEVTKTVCDFLFRHVVLRNDAVAAPAGSAAVAQGAIIEVEAKLGQLIDMDRRDRLQLPLLSESVLHKEGSRFRTSFESTMTVAQHRAMNNFLNEAVKASMPHVNPGRIPLSYAHKKERDIFYEVSPSELPPIIRQNLNPRHKPKVRVTVDQRTGEILAKIVKCRVADLDVYSPSTCVDWRLSVNLEINYEGDVSHLPVVETTHGRGGERNKDRMSYRHLAYQVDLTQVAKSEPSAKGEFEHELEVEISAAEIRRQGQLAMAGDPKNQYEDLVKGFVDNIRVLARAVPP